MSAGALGFGLQANAQLVYDISGDFNQTDNACTAIVFVIGGGDCSYANGRGSAVVWFGPANGAKYYELGSAGDSTSEQPAAPTYAAPVTGSITINDGGTGPLGTDDTIDGEIIIGAVARSLAVGQVTRGVERWDSMTWTFPATAVSAAVANGNGGFDYVVGSKGFPIPICNVDNPALCFPTASYSGISPPTDPNTDLFIVPWSGPDPAGVGIEATAVLTPGGNVGVSPVVTFSNYTCDIINTTTNNPGPECTQPSTANSPTLLGAPVSANIATPTDRWGNLVMRISTNNAGQITEAEVYWTREYYIRFPNSLPAPPQPANSWVGGGFSFTGETPVAKCNDATIEVLEDSPATLVDVLADYCSFPEGATIAITSPPTKGTANVVSNQIQYTPNPGPQGTDTLVYTASAPGEFDGAATLTIVIAPDTTPVTPNGQITISTQGVAPATALGSLDVATLPGFSGGNPPSVITITSQGTKGTATTTGTIIGYTPGADFFTGTDTFTYNVTDAQGDSSATPGEIVVNIPALNPTISGGSITTDQDTASSPAPVTIGAGNGSPAQHTLSILTQGTNGSCSLSGTNAGSPVTVTYTPNADFFGTDSCVVRIVDGDGSGADATFNVTVIEVFGAKPDYAQVVNGQPVVIPVLDNDAGIVFPVKLIIFTNPQYGSVAVSGDGFFAHPVIVYTPFGNVAGSDTFEYAFQVGKRVAKGTVEISLIQTANDADSDGVDDGVDNCLAVANADQRDADGDGYGTRCDADFNNDNRVNFADLSAFRVMFGTTDPVADFNGDGVVNLQDLGLFKGLFSGTPGPSALRP